MATRYEMVDANHPFLGVELVGPGTWVGEDELTTHALLLSYDEVVALVGSPEQLHALLSNALRQVEGVLEPIPCRGCGETKASILSTTCQGGLAHDFT